MRKATIGLKTPLVRGDYKALVKVMGYLVKLRERELETDLMFEPIQETIDLLKEYQIGFPLRIHELLAVSITIH